MDYVNFLENSFKASAVNMSKLSQDESLIKTISLVTELIVNSYQNGGGLFIAGNGGSASDAQHIAAELVVKLDKNRTPLKSFSMSVDTSLLTAIGNDFGYDWVFHRQVHGLMNSNDIFLGISTSGNSPNILKALEACREKGIKSILLTGKDGGKAHSLGLADHFIIAPGEHTAQIQEAHIAIYHCLCFMIEKGLVEAGYVKYF